MINAIEIELSPEAVALVAATRTMPERMLGAIARGMNRAAMLTVADIQEKRLTGQGPFPVEEGRLGVVTSRLRSSLRASQAVIEGESVTVGIGSNVVYAAIHEFGGVINRTVKPGSVLLRTNKKGDLLKRGNLATFAKKSHKLKREVAYEGGKQYTITMPARAPIGHGIADNLPVFEREISAALQGILRGGGEA